MLLPHNVCQCHSDDRMHNAQMHSIDSIQMIQFITYYGRAVYFLLYPPISNVIIMSVFLFLYFLRYILFSFPSKCAKRMLRHDHRPSNASTMHSWSNPCLVCKKLLFVLFVVIDQQHSRAMPVNVGHAVRLGDSCAPHTRAHVHLAGSWPARLVAKWLWMTPCAMIMGRYSHTANTSHNNRLKCISAYVVTINLLVWMSLTLI